VDQVAVVLQNLLFQYQHLQDLILLSLAVAVHMEQKQILHLEMDKMDLGEEVQHLMDPHFLL
jgi:hypothetical protein